MGVPRLFYYIKTQYQKHINHFRKGEFIKPVDNLYLDANPFLHNAAQKVYNYGGGKSVMNRYANLSEEEKLRKTFEIFFRNIVAVTELTPPRKVLYIAIDGPAPLAKQAQQRERRFKSAKARRDFDSNQITPGTIFMLEMTKYIQWAIRKEIMIYSGWKDIDVYFSPPTVAGEGEHKLMDYIRSIPYEIRMGESHCIYGPDGDLIMLTLATHLKEIYLLREADPEKEPDFYDLLNVGKIAADLNYVLSLTKRSIAGTSDDFIVAGFFVGNDFLPKAKMFYYLEDGLERMIDAVSLLSKSKKFLTYKGDLNIEVFTEFVDIVSQHEPHYIADQAMYSKVNYDTIDVTKLRKIATHKGMMNTTNATKDEIVDFLNGFKDTVLLNNVGIKVRDSTPKHISEDKMRHYENQGLDTTHAYEIIDFDKYRKEYYEYAGINDIEGVCIDYLRTMIWILKYYVNGLPSWKWYYPHHYPPLMIDFVEVLKRLTKSQKKETMTFDIDTPSLPFVQLLSVLPPESKTLLPFPYRWIMEPNSPIVDYYPETFIIDYHGLDKEFKGKALLPFVDSEKVEGVYESVKFPKGVMSNYVRNRKGYPSLFRYDSDYLVSFESKYGNIYKLTCKKVDLIDKTDPLVKLIGGEASWKSIKQYDVSTYFFIRLDGKYEEWYIAKKNRKKLWNAIKLDFKENYKVIS